MVKRDEGRDGVRTPQRGLSRERPEPPPEYGEIRAQVDRGEADPRADKRKGATKPKDIPRMGQKPREESR